MGNEYNMCDAIAKKYKKDESETNTQYHQRIKKDFLNKIFQKRHFFRNVEIKFDKGQVTVGKNKEIISFHHVTSSQKSKTEKRVIDIERYEKCMLIFAILDSCKPITCMHITITCNPSFSNRLRVYCSKYRYVIILEDKQKKYDFITAFPVTKNNENKFI
ncbi:MAG: hypothetical protein WC344_05175 [Bacilli bacterium]